MYAGECMVVQNVADGVNQVCVELSHAALSLSGEYGQRAGKGRAFSRSFPFHCNLHMHAHVCEQMMEGVFTAIKQKLLQMSR